MARVLMARFDVYRNPGAQAATTPYLLDVQSDLLDGLETRVVVPLRRLEQFPKVKLPDRLTPILKIEGQSCLLETPKMGAVPRRLLGEPVASLLYERDTISASLEFLFTGY